MLNHHFKVQKFDGEIKLCDFKIGDQFHKKSENRWIKTVIKK
jgi:hypothetical protein